MPAAALELGDIVVESRLGQPLRASIAYALAPHEEIYDGCVTLGLGPSASGLPGVGRTTIKVADGAILLTGKAPVREPMVAARVNVDCAYTANLSREYLVFIDPASPAVENKPPVAVIAPPQSAAVGDSRPAARSKLDARPIAAASRYQVQPGDTLSQIVQRIENRSTSLWPAVNAIFAANPDAFIDNDPNRLKAGSWLAIPGLVTTQLAAPASTSTAAGNGVSSGSAAPIDVAAERAPTTTAPIETAAGDAAPTAADTSADLSPASLAANDENPFVDGRETSRQTLVIADTELEGPVTNSTSPNVATAAVDRVTPAATESSPWLLWLAGSGLGLIIALLLFGRLLRGRPGEPEAPVETPQRRATDIDSQFVPDDGGIEVIAHTGYTIDDDSPTAENLVLDADLLVGTGLDSGTDMDMEVAQDFGFATPTELDLELPFEPQASIPESDTGIFATDDDETAVLEHDELIDDDYDLSVVLDATKMPRTDEITQRDFQAVEVEMIDDTSKTDSYTVEREVDLEILEQDYEDELTATQALNTEIARAAEQLASDRQSADFDDMEITSEVTAATPLASVTELDVTAQLPARDSHDEDETGIHEAATVEMPAAENDETAEMEIDGGKVDTKAR